MSLWRMDCYFCDVDSALLTVVLCPRGTIINYITSFPVRAAATVLCHPKVTDQVSSAITHLSFIRGLASSNPDKVPVSLVECKFICHGSVVSFPASRLEVRFQFGCWLLCHWEGRYFPQSPQTNAGLVSSNSPRLHPNTLQFIIHNYSSSWQHMTSALEEVPFINKKINNLRVWYCVIK
jgi:hypothetical protein